MHDVFEEQAVSPTTDLIANRLATETFMRSVDLLNEVVGGNTSHGLLLNALWCQHLSGTVAPRRSLILPKEWNEPMSIHRLARALRLPYPTVHRYLSVFVEKGMAVRAAEGRVEISPGLVDGRIGETFRRRSLASVSRFLVGLHRLGVLAGPVDILEREDGLSPFQRDVIFRANMESVLINLLLTAEFYEDLAVGLFYKLVSIANIKHLSEMPPGAVDYVPDSLRRPISIYGAAKALHMPYETARRISKRMIAQGHFVQIGDQGLIAPAEAHRRLDGSMTLRDRFRAVSAGLEQIRHAGLLFTLPGL